MFWDEKIGGCLLYNTQHPKLDHPLVYAAKDEKSKGITKKNT
jgi:hypothetical protein